VVGSRSPAPDTLRWMTRELGQFMMDHDACIVSGGARGVDQHAHRIALDTGKPTICILPSGLLNPYPPMNERLWKRIRDEGGCLISTHLPMRGMERRLFENRNRCIVGLTWICLVMEANRRSGSYMTGRLAWEEDRILLTIPISPMATQGLGNFDLMVDFGAGFIRDHIDLMVAWSRARPSRTDLVI
jgi:DNA processing protein